jgi:SAM-dependent methyltransferase
MDPIGKAILDYDKFRRPGDIVVSSDICEDDIIPVEVLFRTYDEMPELEKMALKESKGTILDVGAGAGSHAKYLSKKGHQVLAIDTSKGAIEYLNAVEIPAKNIDFFDFTGQKFDTVLLLMNGIGIAGELANLEKTLAHAKTLLNPGGQILCDSSDIKYLYEDEDGSLWMDLNSEYYGNFKFQMKYKKEVGPWFNWLYVDFDNLFKVAKKLGFNTTRLMEKDNHYLAKLALS